MVCPPRIPIARTIARRRLDWLAVENAACCCPGNGVVVGTIVAGADTGAAECIRLRRLGGWLWWWRGMPRLLRFADNARSGNRRRGIG